MRNMFKLTLFFILEYSGSNALFRYLNRGKIKVLMYHSISPVGSYFNNSVSESEFICQINYLLKHYSILSVTQDGQFLNVVPNKVNVLLTFDDGFKDNYTIAAPILSRFGLSAVFFVIGECLESGAAPSFVKNRLGKSPIPDVYRTVNVSEAIEMHHMGMIIGSHGQVHVDYSKVSFEDGMKDALESKVLIEKEIEKPVALFAFPWGKYQELHLVKLAGVYRRIFITQHGFNAQDDFMFHRNEISNTPHLWCAASGALDFFRELIGLRSS